MTDRRHIPNVAAGLTLIFLVTGCESPAHRAAVAHREENLNTTLSLLAEMEATRPHQLDATLQVIAERHRQDVAAGQRLPPTLEQALREEFERFDQRGPLYRKQIHEQFEGDVDSIERTLPHVLY